MDDGETIVVGSHPSSASADASTTDAASPSAEAPAVGHNMRRYVVLEEAGRGGMGRVLRAYDPKLQREVALKVLNRGALGTEATERLVAEARAMAKLSHPNVVAVYDVEALDDGQVMLVMEYVAGQTLQGWLADKRWPWTDVLAHFVPAGRGLAAAHAADLLHRDFKPANVLVSESRVKVTDFGLAKAPIGAATAEPTSGDNSLTQTGTVMGTPVYMSPEQHRGQALTPATDQYSFCVALWAALCGKRPFATSELPQNKFDGPPPWPQGLAVPQPIGDAIVRGLSVDPAERWPSMEALLDALDYDPAARKRRWVAALGVVGVGALAWQLRAAEEAPRCSGAQQQLDGVWNEGARAEIEAAIMDTGLSYAASTWSKVAVELDGWATGWLAMHVEACEATQRHEQSESVMDLRMACLYRARLGLKAAANVFADATPEVVRNAHRVVGTLPRLERCADVDALQADVEPPPPEQADAVKSVHAEIAEARVRATAGEYDAALAAVHRAEAGLEGLEYAPVRAEVELVRGLVLELQGEYTLAEAALRRVLSYATAQQRDVVSEAVGRLTLVVGVRLHRPAEALAFRELANWLSLELDESRYLFHNTLGMVLDLSARYEEAETEYKAALALRRDEPEGMSAAMVRGNLAIVLQSQGRYAEAVDEQRAVIRVLEAAIGADNPEVASARSNLGGSLGGQGDYEAAEAEFRAALALQLKALAGDHPLVAATRKNLGTVLNHQGRHDEAEAEIRAALAAWLKQHGADYRPVARARITLAISLTKQGKNEEAETQLRTAIAAMRKAVGADDTGVALARVNLGAVLLELGKLEEAVSQLRTALEVQHKAWGTDHPAIAAAHQTLARVLNQQGHHQEAEAEFRAAIEVTRRTLGAEHPNLAAAQMGLAAMLIERGDRAEALPLLERAWAIHRESDAGADTRADAALALADALSADPAQGDRVQALTETARQLRD